MAETKVEHKVESKHSGPPKDSDHGTPGNKMDPKHKKEIILASVVGGIILLYFYMKNASSATAATPATPAANTSGTDTTGNGGTGSAPSVSDSYNTTNNTTTTTSSDISGSYNPVTTYATPKAPIGKKTPTHGKAGGTTIKKATNITQNTGGKMHLTSPITKSTGGVHISGGTGKKSGTTSTLKGFKTVGPGSAHSGNTAFPSAGLPGGGNPNKPSPSASSKRPPILSKK